jgi:hypothetical protein
MVMVNALPPPQIIDYFINEFNKIIEENEWTNRYKLWISLSTKNIVNDDNFENSRKPT